jgi:hypothetical protein
MSSPLLHTLSTELAQPLVILAGHGPRAGDRRELLQIKLLLELTFVSMPIVQNTVHATPEQ